MTLPDVQPDTDSQLPSAQPPPAPKRKHRKKSESATRKKKTRSQPVQMQDLGGSLSGSDSLSSPQQLVANAELFNVDSLINSSVTSVVPVDAGSTASTVPAETSSLPGDMPPPRQSRHRTRARRASPAAQSAPLQATPPGDMSVPEEPITYKADYTPPPIVDAPPPAAYVDVPMTGSARTSPAQPRQTTVGSSQSSATLSYQGDTVFTEQTQLFTSSTIDTANVAPPNSASVTRGLSHTEYLRSVAKDLGLDVSINGPLVGTTSLTSPPPDSHLPTKRAASATIASESHKSPAASITVPPAGSRYHSPLDPRARGHKRSRSSSTSSRKHSRPSTHVSSQSRAPTNSGSAHGSSLSRPQSSRSHSHSRSGSAPSSSHHTSPPVLPSASSQRRQLAAARPPATTTSLPDMFSYVNPALGLPARGGLVPSVQDIQLPGLNPQPTARPPQQAPPQDEQDDSDSSGSESGFSTVEGDDDTDSDISIPDSIRPLDSISNIAAPTRRAPSTATSTITAPASASAPTPNPLAGYRGMESSLNTGIAQALPKPARGITPSNQTNIIWFHMRGLSTSTDRIPKADQLLKNFTTPNAPAFRPPPIAK